MAMSADGDVRDPFEVVGTRRDDDVHVLRASDDTPSVDGEATHQDKLDACAVKPLKKLVEGRLGQVRRAAPVNRIS